MKARMFAIRLGLCAVALCLLGCAGSPRAEPTAQAPASAGPFSFQAPVSLCMDAKSRIYVNDRNLCRVVRIDDISGAGLLAFGQQGYGGPGRFRISEGGMALDGQGRIYVVISRSSKLVRFDDMEGRGWTELDTGALGLPTPGGVALDAEGRIYLTDTYRCIVARVDSMAGDGLLVFGEKGEGLGQFQDPRSLRLDAEGRIYVTDAVNHRVCRFDDMQGTNWRSWDGKDGKGQEGFLEPTCIAIAADGSIYVSDSGSCRIFHFADISGAGREVWGWDGSGARSFMPVGLCLDGEGRILFTDGQGKRIVRMDDMRGKGLVSYPPLEN